MTWSASFLAQDPEALKQMKQYRLHLRKDDHTRAAKQRNAKKARYTWIEDDFAGKVGPVYGMCLPLPIYL
jgi:hypothetical protein